LFMRRSLALAGIALALAASVTTTSAQQAKVQVGVLECRGGASVGFIVGSVTNLGCVLRAAGQPDDFYVATIRKVGLDLGITAESASVSAATYWSAAPTIRSRCSRSACRARSAFPSLPDSRAWNCVRAVNAAVNRMQARNARCTASETSVILPATFSRLPKSRDRRSIAAADPIMGRLQH
jgi:uncharacterized protein DUF992